MVPGRKENSSMSSLRLGAFCVRYLSANQVECAPEAGVFDEGELGADGEGLPAELAVDHGVAEAEGGLVGRAIAGEGGGGDEGFEQIAIGEALAADFYGVRLDFAGAFFGAVDGEQYGDGLVELTAGADGQKGEAVAETAGAVDVLGVAGVDPDLHAVAVVDP